MRNIFITALITIPLISFAATSTFDPAKAGWPVSDGGIQVRPIKKMSLNASPNKFLIEQNDIKTKGFYKTDFPQARIIYNMRNKKVLPAGSSKVEDTNLKSTIADVGLAFKFNGIPGIKKENIVGYAAVGSYQSNGWTGITEIIKDPNLGTCQYTLNNIKLSHGSEIVPEEGVRLDVNGKVTMVDVRGDVNSGYSTLIHWADANYMNDLECANMIFDKANTQKAIKLAVKIDKSLSVK